MDDTSPQQYGAAYSGQEVPQEGAMYAPPPEVAEATSQFPQGVTFVTPPMPVPAEAYQNQPQYRKRILIVEDERPLAHALELKLNHDGYETMVAATGTDGLREALSGQYHLMLLDLILPEIDGFEVLRQLREQGVMMPVIILSNLGQEEDRQRVAAYNVAQYCVKSNMPLSAIVSSVKTLTL